MVVLFWRMRVLIYLKAFELRRSYLIPGGDLGQFAEALLEECAEGVVFSVGCRAGAFVHFGLNM